MNESAYLLGCSIRGLLLTYLLEVLVGALSVNVKTLRTFVFSSTAHSPSPRERNIQELVIATTRSVTSAAKHGPQSRSYRGVSRAE